MLRQIVLELDSEAYRALLTCLLMHLGKFRPFAANSGKFQQTSRTGTFRRASTSRSGCWGKSSWNSIPCPTGPFRLASPCIWASSDRLRPILASSSRRACFQSGVLVTQADVSDWHRIWPSIDRNVWWLAFFLRPPIRLRHVSHLQHFSSIAFALPLRVGMSLRRIQHSSLSFSAEPLQRRCLDLQHIYMLCQPTRLYLIPKG